MTEAERDRIERAAKKIADGMRPWMAGQRDQLAALLRPVQQDRRARAA
jgi:hypothetical protein